MGMRRGLLTFTVGLLTMLAVGPASAQQDGTARGVLFYSPLCGHCHIVIEDHLPGIFEDHGGAPDGTFDARDEAAPPFTMLSNGTLDLLMVNVMTEHGASLYWAATDAYGISEDQQGVPRLVMGDQFFVGSGDIPASLPGLIADGLAAGGMDWPDFPGLDEVLAGLSGAAETTTTTTTTAPVSTTAPSGESIPTPETAPTPETTSTTITPFPVGGGGPGSTDGIGGPPDSIGEKFRSDLAGNSLAVVVLAGMLASLFLVWVLVRKGRLAAPPGWLIPVLAAAGVFVAIYLTYVETSGAEAVCGPVGNCNAVQESKFALLFGLIHVGLVGLISYAVVIGTWLASRFLKAPWADRAAVALALGAAAGVAFSIYLTFLEPFVIGATCIWCLSSAVIVTGLFWITAGPGWAAWRRLRSG